MKKDILKISGAKSLEEFYHLYPTEEAFKKAFPKEFKKAKMGASMVKKQLTQLTDFANPPQAQVGTYIGGNTSAYKPVNYTDMYDQADYATTGMNRQMRMQDQNIAAQQAQAANAGNKGGLDLGNLMQAAGSFAQMAESMRQGGYIPRAQGGDMISQFGPQLASYKKGKINSPTGQVTKQQTQGLGYKSDGSNFNTNNFALGMQNFGKDVGEGYDALNSGLSDVGGVSGALGIGKDLLSGFQELKKEKDIQKQTHQFHRLSGLTNDVAGLTPDIAARKYVRPEDMQFDPNQMGQSRGSAPNNPYLQMQEGGNIGGNPTEIQNMYSSGDLYSNLGYEPLNDSDVIKQYRRGGLIQRAQFGDKMAGQAGGALGSLIGGGHGRPTAGGKIGSTIGSTVGKFIPIPGASAILGGVGGLIGGIAGGASAKKTENWQTEGEQNMQNAAFTQGTRALQAQNSSFMEDGGWVSHNWQPQTITKFGDYNVEDLLRRDPTMDTLRSGGHLKNYAPPSEQSMSTERMAMGGQLKTTWGGHAETISHNPYLPGSGETVMFRGKSHEESDGNGHTGIGVKYGSGSEDDYTDYAQYGTEQADADVEVERGEPATELRDGETGETNMVVWGDMKIPSYGVSELKDPKAKGKKFKNYANDLSKIENRHSKLLQKSIEKLNSLNPVTAFEKLEFDTLSKIVDGANMSLKGLASQKELLGGLQNAILDTSKEFGVKSADLAKGKIKQDRDADMAKFGGKFTQAQSGITKGRFPSPVDERGNYYMPGYAPYQIDGGYSSLPEITIRGKKAKNQMIGQIPMNRNVTSPETPEMNVTLPTYASSMQAINQGSAGGNKGTDSKFNLMDLWREAQPYMVPSNQEPIDPNQFAAEMYDLSTNAPVGVQAQQYMPQLETPYSVSLQDQLNANQADFNSMQRQQGYNPAAASQLAAQKYAANSAILGQQTRANQEMQMGAFNRNRGVLNDATMKNLEILDRQYGRQQQGLSNTKAQAHAALASISDKIAKHKLENRTLGVYENLYNYRFGPKGRAMNVNAPAEFNMDGNPFARTAGAGKGQLSPGYEFTYDANQNIIGTRKSSKDVEADRNGGIVKAIKNL